MKVRKSRQAAGLSQAAFADLAGIPLRTYKRFESHGKANLETFVAALRALERTQYLVTLFPADARMPVSPTLEETLRITRARRLRPS
jgi:transcriptional regulator with XRE-family HTH domain